MCIKIIPLLLALTLSLSMFSCRKDKATPDETVRIDERNLTACPERSECRYYFTENSDFGAAVFPLTSGAYRMFSINTASNGYGYILYIKAPMTGTSFSFNKKDIVEGRVKIINTCISCMFIPMEPIDGYVKGLNLTPDKPAAQAKWILEAKIIMETKTEPQTTTDIYVKQYFSFSTDGY